MTVLRWHNNSDPRLRNSRDCIDGHQRRVAVLVHELCALIGHPLHDSDLVRWALVHDEAERITGDVPGPAKRRWPKLAAALEDAEREARRDLGIAEPNLSAREQRIFKLCDALDAFLWAHACQATHTIDWQAEMVRLQAMAAGIDARAVEWAREYQERETTP